MQCAHGPAKAGERIAVDGERQVVKSCFRDAVDRIREIYKDRLLGFRIVVEEAVGPERGGGCVTSR
jgi:hypothetical protein